MRKLLLAVVVMFLMAGLVVGVEVSVVSYDKEKKELTVKEGEKEKVYKVGKDAKFNTTDIKGDNSKESNYEAFEKYVSSKGKGKGGRKVDITTEKDTITGATWKTFMKKDKN